MKIELTFKDKKTHITKDDSLLTFPITKGFRQLKELTTNPFEEIFCVHLHSEDYFCNADPTYSSNNPIADEKYIRECKHELNRLIGKMALYKQYHDLGNIEKTQEEIDKLTDYLQQIYNPLKNKCKNLPGEFTRCRDSVAKSLRRVFDLIADHDIELAQYLRKTIRIGYYCCYHQDMQITIEAEWNS